MKAFSKILGATCLFTEGFARFKFQIQNSMSMPWLKQIFSSGSCGCSATIKTTGPACGRMMASLWLLFPYFALVSGTDLQAYKLGSGTNGTDWSCDCIVKDDTCSCSTDDGVRTHTLHFSMGYGGLKFPVMSVYAIHDNIFTEVGLMKWQWPSGAGYVGSLTSNSGAFKDDLLKAEPYSSAKREEHEL